MKKLASALLFGISGFICIKLYPSTPISLFPYKVEVVTTKVEQSPEIDFHSSIEVSDFKLFLNNKRHFSFPVKELIVPMQDLQAIVENPNELVQTRVEFGVTPAQANRIICVTPFGQKIFLSDYGQTTSTKIANKIARNPFVSTAIAVASAAASTVFVLGAIVLGKGMGQNPRFKTYHDKLAEVDASGNKKYGKFGAAIEQAKFAFASSGSAVAAPAAPLAPVTVTPKIPVLWRLRRILSPNSLTAATKTYQQALAEHRQSEEAVKWAKERLKRAADQKAQAVSAAKAIK